MNSEQTQQALTRAEEALQKATQANEAGQARVTEAEVKLNVAQEALTTAMAAEAAGGPSSKPQRQKVEDAVHALEVAQAGMPALLQNLNATSEAQRTALREHLHQQLTERAAELDAHPVAGAVLAAVDALEDFETKRKAMTHIKEQYVQAGGGNQEFPRRKLRGKPSRMEYFGLINLGCPGPEAVQITV